MDLAKSSPSPLFASLSNAVLQSVVIFAAQCLVYATTAPHFGTERKRAYILSVLSSSIMSLLSLPYIYSYLHYGLHQTYEAAQTGWLFALAHFGVVYFGVYLSGKFFHPRRFAKHTDSMTQSGFGGWFPQVQISSWPFDWMDSPYLLYRYHDILRQDSRLAYLAYRRYHGGEQPNKMSKQQSES